MWQIWLILSGIFFVCEIITVGFMIFWLGIAALLTALVSVFIDNIVIETAVFVVSSSLLIPLTKPFVDKYIKPKTTLTNAYSVLGKKGIVTTQINPTNGSGQVKIGTEIWSAKSENGLVIPKDSEIEVLKIDGVKVLVKQI